MEGTSRIQFHVHAPFRIPPGKEMSAKTESKDFRTSIRVVSGRSPFYASTITQISCVVALALAMSGLLLNNGFLVINSRIVASRVVGNQK